MNPRVAYCTNVHAGEDLATTVANLETHSTRVRELVSPHGALGLGLWLSSRAASELSTRDDVRRLRDRLDSLGLAVVTLNGFPFGDFHSSRVKHAVYEPHWAQRERLVYTIRLAEILADLVPPGTAHASISTLPIGWRSTFMSDGCGANVGLAISHLEAMAHALARLESERGVRITVDVEPEPGCLLDRSQHVVELFGQALHSDVARRHLGVCHDICHAAVMFESQADAIATYRRAGVRVNKIQVSSAIECDGSAEAIDALSKFVEPRYLHQTSVRDDSGSQTGNIHFFEDLPAAIAARRPGTWRTHFHVPIHLLSLDSLTTTQRDIRACLAAVRDDRPILEVETYAWTVLPESLQPARLADGIADELRWLEGAIR